MTAYRYVGGPLDGQMTSGWDGRPLTRSGSGEPLRNADGDRAVLQMNLGQEPDPVYIRMRGAYRWVPGLAAQRQADRLAREEQQRHAAAADPQRWAETQARAQATRAVFMRAWAEQERRCAQRRDGGGERERP